MDAFHSNPLTPITPVPSPPAKEQTRGAKSGTNWLLRLSYLPRQLCEEAAYRICRGDSVRSVARWLAGRKDRGQLSGVGEHSLRRYLGALASEIAKEKPLHPTPTVEEALAGAHAALPVLPIPAPIPRRQGARFQTLEQWLGDFLYRYNNDLATLTVIKTDLQYLDFLRRAEEVLINDEKPVPLHAMAKAHAQASAAVLRGIDQYNKNDESRLKREKDRQNIGEIDEEKLHPTRRQAPVEGQGQVERDEQGKIKSLPLARAKPNNNAKLSIEEQMTLRSLYEQHMKIIELERLKNKQQCQSAADDPTKV